MPVLCPTLPTGPLRMQTEHNVEDLCNSLRLKDISSFQGVVWFARVIGIRTLELWRLQGAEQAWAQRRCRVVRTPSPQPITNGEHHEQLCLAKSRRVPCARTVPERSVLTALRLALSEKQIPQIIENTEKPKVENGSVGVGSAAPKGGAPITKSRIGRRRFDVGSLRKSASYALLKNSPSLESVDALSQ